MRGFFSQRFAAGFLGCVGGGVLAVFSAGAQAGFVIDGEATAVYDSNVSRAERDRDILKDESMFGSVSLAWRGQPGNTTAVSVRGFVEGEAYNEITTLGRVSAGGQAVLRWQPVLGFMQPVYQFSATAQLDDYNVDQRDSMVYTVQAFASQRVNDRIMASYGLEGVLRESDGTVFDTSNGRAFLSLDFSLSKTWSAYGAYSFLYGNTFSSAQIAFCDGTPAGDIFPLIQASEAIEKDAAFNSKFCGTWVAYRLDATTNSLTLGLNKAFNHSLSADFSVQGVDVHAEGDNNYQRMLVRAGLLARF
ncbi:MAG: hypothetical protein REI12_02140 [Pedobacter sp.]|nr:hypothetical protein [Pedobacter sp.]